MRKKRIVSTKSNKEKIENNLDDREQRSVEEGDKTRKSKVNVAFFHCTESIR